MPVHDCASFLSSNALILAKLLAVVALNQLILLISCHVIIVIDTKTKYCNPCCTCDVRIKNYRLRNTSRDYRIALIFRGSLISRILRI